LGFISSLPQFTIYWDKNPKGFVVVVVALTNKIIEIYPITPICLLHCPTVEILALFFMYRDMGEESCIWAF
jgi:hypothetical protein